MTEETKDVQATGGGLSAGKLLPVLLSQVKIICDKAEEDRFATVTLENAEKAAELLARLRAAEKEIDAKAKVDAHDIANETPEIKDAFLRVDAVAQASLDWRNRVKVVAKKIADGLVALYEGKSVDAETKLSISKRVTGVLGSTATFVPKKGYAFRPISTENEAAIRIAVGRMLGVNPVLLAPVSTWIDAKRVQDMPEAAAESVGLHEVTTHHVTTRARELVS